jgi:hypothetical protein
MENTASPALLEGQKSLRGLMKVVWALLGIGIFSSSVTLGAILYSGLNFTSLDGEASFIVYRGLALGIVFFVSAILIFVFVAKNLAKGRNWARWVYLAFAVWEVYSSIGYLSAAANGSIMGVVLVLLYIVGTALQVYICVQLFKSPARLVFLQDRLQRMEKDLQDLKG